MNSQQLLHFKQKMMKDFYKLNYEHFTSESDTTPEPNDTETNDTSMMIATETNDNTDDVEDQTDENNDTELAPTMGPVMSTTEFDDNIYSTTRRQGLGGRYLS